MNESGISHSRLPIPDSPLSSQKALELEAEGLFQPLKKVLTLMAIAIEAISDELGNSQSIPYSQKIRSVILN
ncbi:MAG: hypothetical protein Fur006_61840 [Coleofasciculaceae cyanobacterium]